MYTFANMQHCWQHYVTHVRPQPVFPISGALSAYRKPTGVIVILLKKSENPWYRLQEYFLAFIRCLWHNRAVRRSCLQVERGRSRTHTNITPHKVSMEKQSACEEHTYMCSGVHFPEEVFHNHYKWLHNSETQNMKISMSLRTGYVGVSFKDAAIW